MNIYRINMWNITQVIKAIWQIHVPLSPNTLLIASFNRSIYGNILIERTREISIIFNMKIPFDYDISDGKLW